MKKFLQQYGFALAFFLFLLHQVVQKGLQWQLGWIDWYLDDLLCLPILLSIWQWERHRLWGWPPLQTAEVVGSILLAGLVFEVAYPALSPAYTQDWADWIAYAIGGILFGWVNQGDKKRKSLSCSV